MTLSENRVLDILPELGRTATRGNIAKRLQLRPKRVGMVLQTLKTLGYAELLWDGRAVWAMTARGQRAT